MFIPDIVARQWLGKNVTTAMNTHAILEESLDALFSVHSTSCQGKQAIRST
jgi:hypothetical protein